MKNIFQIALVFLLLSAYSDDPLASSTSSGLKLENLENYITLSNCCNVNDYESTGFKPRKDLPAVKIDLPIDWNMDPFTDRNWQYQLHSWRNMDHYIREYRDNPTEYFEKILAIALDWQEFHQENTSKMQWYDMATGNRAMKLAWILEKTKSRPELETIRKLAIDHIEKLLDPKFLANNNHAYFQLAGLKLLCSEMHDYQSCSQALTYADSEMKKLLANQFSEEFLHKEHSPGYHFFVLKSLRQLRVNKLFGPEVSSILEKANQLKPWLIFPDGWISRSGDSASRIRTRIQKARTVSLHSSKAIQLKDMKNSGLVTLRSNPATNLKDSFQIFIKGMANKGYAHKHSDELSFELFQNSRHIFIDTGQYSYNIDPFRVYALGASSHNTVSYSFYPITRHDTNYKLVEAAGIIQSVNWDETTLTVTGSYQRPNMFRHERKFKYEPNDKLEIEDRINTEDSLLQGVLRIIAQDKITSNLHLHPSIKVKAADDKKLELESIGTIELVSDQCTLSTSRGSKFPLLGWTSFSYNEIEETTTIQAICPLFSEIKLKWVVDFI